MRTLSLTAIILNLALSLTIAQTTETRSYWIFLRDRIPPAISLQATYVARSLGISERALKRRAKSLPPDRVIDEFDFPVSEISIAQIRQSGVRIRFVSRWLNAVSVEATPQQIQSLLALPMVKKAEPVFHLVHPQPLPSQGVPVQPFKKKMGTTVLDYGQSLTQLSNIKVVDLHNIGIIGTGVLIGMLDDGFNNYRTHRALKNIKIIADSDFIHNIKDVGRQPWENPEQGNHGAGTLSVLGGFDNGQLVGAALGASFVLAKTEMDSSGNTDFHSEEDTYVAGLEWMERLGVDITSSSLAYKDFSSPPYYATSDLNGRTTKVAQAALIAARKGVLPVTAMGNEGYQIVVGTDTLHADSTLWSPADADSIIAVGATSSDGELAAFSSCGPTADGRIKPEVVAQGMGVLWADGTTDTAYGFASGTSLSTPLVAGAAALVLSAHPGLTAIQVRQALLNTAVHINDGTSQTHNYPNNYYGYGFVDALSAALYYGPVFSNQPLVIKTDSSYRIYIWIQQSSSVRMDSVFLHFKRMSDSFFQQAEFVPAQNNNEYVVTLPLSSIDSTSIGYITARDQSGTIRQAPFDAPATLFSLVPTSDSVMVILPPVYTIPTKYILYQNYPNPFNNGTTITFEIPVTSVVDITIYNLLGQRVKTIFHNQISPTKMSKQWDGTDEQGHNVATGMYIVRLKASTTVLSKKMLYLK